MADRIEGRCRCGEVRFAVDGAPLVTVACHCTGCQQMTASAFSLSSIYPADRFRVLAGEPVLGGLRGATRHDFCPSCMSWLFTRPEGMDEFVNVRSTLLDNAAGYTPFIETFTSEKLSWAITGAVHSFARFPEEEDFPSLLAAFTERAA